MPTPPPLAETEDDRRARHLAGMRELFDLGMAMARKAAAGYCNDTPPEPGAPDPALTFARAAAAVRQAAALEARIAAGPLGRDPAAARPARPVQIRPPPPFDPRRAPLRDNLHKAAAAEPDRAARTALCRHIDARIEEELADPGLTLPDVFFGLCDELGLEVDLAKLPDAIIGLEPRRRPVDGSDIPLWHAYVEPGRVDEDWMAPAARDHPPDP